MSQPLDFSSGARKPAPPQTNRGRPPRPSGGPAGKKRLLTILALVVLLLGGGYVAVVVFDVFGREDDTLTGATRYCVLAGQLDQVSLTTGAASSTGIYDGPSEKVKAAVGQMGTGLQDLRRLAPTAVNHDQGVVLDALKKAAAGDSTQVRTPAFAEAAARVRAFTASHCGGGGAGD